ncbi:MAG TPA: response regulator transcription factor [Deltaproteobacteria bacterium]|nr:response regulator transcription factor [Deltaproteobacteria bacterium]
MAETLLLVEDDVRLTELLSEYLGRLGFVVSVEGNGERAVARIQAEVPDAVILDIGLEGLDGLAVCRRVREQYAGPILIFSARGDEVDQVIGLEVGADDYVPKPASPRLLLARLRALLRRSAGTAAPRVEVGALIVDAASRTVTVAGEPIELTTAEFDLLWALARSAGRPVSRQELMQACRGIDYDGLDRSLDVRVAKLRQRLGDAEARRLIKTVRGVGYQLAIER